MSKEIIKVEKKNVQVQDQNSVESFISQALATNVSPETLERLFDLKERVDAERAKTAFVEAMAVFQSECPVIKKTKKVLNKDGQSVRYTYAPIDSIVEQIKKPLAKSGLSYTWNVENKPGVIKATCTITHKLGYSQSSDFEIPIDTEGYMTAPQKFASALTFAKRYTLCNALGISTGDEDTDAVDVGKEKTAKSDKSKIIFLLKTLGKPNESKEQIEKVVKELTQLDLVESNYHEIVNRLEVIVSENNEDREIS